MSDLNRRQLILAGTAGLAALVTSGATRAETTGAARKQSVAMGRLEGKVALITGAAQGIGRETALALAREGADIAFCDLGEQLKTARYPMGTPEKMEETKRLVQAEGRKCLSVKADVRDIKQMRSFADKTLKEFGKIDIAIANAGTACWGLLSDITDDDLPVQIMTGVKNAFRRGRRETPPG